MLPLKLISIGEKYKLSSSPRQKFKNHFASANRESIIFSVRATRIDPPFVSSSLIINELPNFNAWIRAGVAEARRDRSYLRCYAVRDELFKMESDRSSQAAWPAWLII